MREIKALATLVVKNDKYYWKVILKNYDIFDKLEEKVNNILPILQYSNLYENIIGISLTTNKTKVNMIVDYYCNLLDKTQKKMLTEKVRVALMYL